MIRSDRDTVEVRGYGSTVHCEFAQLAHAMIMKGVATPERLKELIDIANEIVEEKKAEVIDLSERAAELDRIIGMAVKEIIAVWAEPDDEKGTDNK